MIVALLALAQVATWSVTPDAPTVGDTIWLVRRASAPAGVQARLRPLHAGAVIEPLAGPRARYTEGTLSLLYTVAVFEPGTHRVAMPAVELLYPDGRVANLAGGTVVLRVRSVLPTRGGRAEPKPSLGPLARRPTRAVPLMMLVGAALAFTVAWGIARRRTRPRPLRPPEPAGAVTPSIDRWVAAGEPRAVAAVTTERVRRRIAGLVPAAGGALDTEQFLAVVRDQRPAWPVERLADLLHSLERARFAPAVPSDVMIVVDQAELLLQSLEPAPEDAA